MTKKKSSRSSRRSKVSTKQQQYRESIKLIATRVLYVVLLAALVGGLTCILFSPQFMISTLAIKSNDTDLKNRLTQVVKNEINKSVLFVPGTNQLLWTDRKLENLLQKDFPGVKDFDIQISDNEMYIVLEQYQPTAVWCPVGVLQLSKSTLPSCITINDHGQVFAYQATETISTDDVLWLSDRLSVPKNGQQVIDPGVLAVLQDLKKDLRSRGYQTGIIMMFEDRVEINLSTEKTSTTDIRQLIIPTDSINTVIKDVLLVIDENELSTVARRENISYFEIVDFTSPNKVFYQFVSNE